MVLAILALFAFLRRRAKRRALAAKAAAVTAAAAKARAATAARTASVVALDRAIRRHTAMQHMRAALGRDLTVGEILMVKERVS